LNADMGESYGPWKMGNDDILLDIVTSANIACGFHAGDPNIMLNTMKMAKDKDVGIGAHPGFHDLEGFGRNRLSVPISTLQNQVRYQVGAALGMARAAGTTVRHIKLHGAMSNMASEDTDTAYALYDAALSVAPEATIMVLAATAQQMAAEKLGCKWVGEIFADRAYNDDATLVDRKFPGAVIHDAAIAGPRIADMVEASAIITQSGKYIPTKIDTICLHGDTPEAIEIAKSTRQALRDRGVQLEKFSV
jgi:UPF0271 protein